MIHRAVAPAHPDGQAGSEMSMIQPDDSPAAVLTARLYSEHAEALHGWARGRIADERDAEELVAETLVRAWRRYEQFDPSRGSERAWVFGIARNAAIDLHRHSQRRLRTVTDDEFPEVGEPGVVDRLAEISLISDALADLSDQHRTVIVQAFVHGRTSSQIAHVLGIPTGTVKSRMFYGMRSLRAALEEREVLQ